MDKETAFSVLQKTTNFLRRAQWNINSEVRPCENQCRQEFCVEHEVFGPTRAQAVQILLTRFKGGKLPLVLSRRRRDEESDRIWIVEQQSIDLVAQFTSHLCDALFADAHRPKAEIVDDPGWEEEVRAGLCESFSGQFQVALTHSQEHGREIIVWNIPGELEAESTHEFLVHRFAEMLVSTHFTLSAVEDLDPRFRGRGWIATAHEH